MKSYLMSLLSIKKFIYKNISFFSYWDSRSSFTKYSEIKRFVKLKNTQIGKYSRVNPFCNLANTIVGNFTAIGRNTTIGLGTHPLNYVSTQNIFYKKNNMNNKWVNPIKLKDTSIEIGNDVWIGVEAMILDGVKVGDGAVVGARAVVTKDVPPYAIVVGVPAKIIKYRFDEIVIKRLLEIKWWNLLDNEISQKVNFFRKPNVTLDFLNQYFPQN